MPEGTEITDSELRRMRDCVYPGWPDNIQSDASWENVKKFWRMDVEWLTAEYKKIIARGNHSIRLAKNKQM